MNDFLEELVHFQARRATDFFQLFAALSDHDRLLARTLDPDDGVDHQAPVVLFFEALDADGQSVGKLLAQTPSEFLANDFRSKKLIAAIRDLLRREVRGRLRKVAREYARQIVQTTALQSR